MFDVPVDEVVQGVEGGEVGRGTVKDLHNLECKKLWAFLKYCKLKVYKTWAEFGGFLSDFPF